jgi:hypothetical protein
MQHDQRPQQNPARDQQNQGDHAVGDKEHLSEVDLGQVHVVLGRFGSASGWPE